MHYNLDIFWNGLAFITLCLCIFVGYIKFENNKCLKNLPGPKPNFFIGNIDILIGVPKHKFLDLLQTIVETYGPIFKMYVGPLKLAATIADTKFLEYILTSTKLSEKAEQYKFLHPWIGTGLLTSSGTKWKKRRRILTAGFHFSILENFVEVFENVGDIFIKKLEKEVAKNSIDIHSFIRLCSLDIICETSMGIKLNAQGKENLEYVKAVKEMCRIIAFRLLIPIPSYIYCLTPHYYKERKLLKILHAHTDDIITQRIAAKSTNKDNENNKKLFLLDLLLEAKIDGQPLSRTDIREEVDTFMFEGHDTTAAGLSYTIFALTENLDVQRKAYDEQKSIFSKDLKNAKPTIAQLQEMKYLELIIKESLRLYPPIPLLARQFTQDVTWDKNVFPKNINILIPLYVIHRNREFFDDPEKFIPERFEESTKPFVYFPFSAGPRNCIGQKFAMLEMKSILSKVIRNFELIPATPKHDLKLASNIVLESLNGVCIALKIRE